MNRDKGMFMPADWVGTEIMCPECKKPLYRNTKIVLTTYPIQYQYKCISCGWTNHH